jgi:hypothetical protein
MGNPGKPGCAETVPGFFAFLEPVALETLRVDRTLPKLTFVEGPASSAEGAFASFAFIRHLVWDARHFRAPTDWPVRMLSLLF